MVARRPRLGADSRFAELVEGWLFALDTTKPAVAAYRRDQFAVARRIGAEDDVGVLRLEHLT